MQKNSWKVHVSGFTLFHSIAFFASSQLPFFLFGVYLSRAAMGVKGKPKHWKAVPQQDGFKSPISIGQRSPHGSF